MNLYHFAYKAVRLSGTTTFSDPILAYISLYPEFIT